MVHMASKDPPLQESQLVVKRIGGGNLTRYRPLFSPDASTVFVVKGCVIQAYSTKTGAFIQNYVGLEKLAIGVQLHPIDNNLLVACSEQGDLISWNLNDQSPGKTVKLNVSDSIDVPANFVGFQLIVGKKQAESTTYDVFTTISTGVKQKLRPLIFCSTSGNVREQALKFEVDNHPNSFGYGGLPGKEFLATISGNELSTMYTSTFETTRHLINNQNGAKFTCVTCHPTKEILATGNTLGMVIVWYDFLKKRRAVTKSIYHWHQLPVQAIVFSQEGSFFYSGAGECVLVKWTLDAPDKSFLPRCSAPIQQLAIATGNQLVAAALGDNTMVIMTPLLKTVSIIQSLTCGIRDGIDYEPFVAGICVHPLRKSLVLNGRVGHIQFFDPVKQKLDFNLDITSQNYITQEKDRTIVNTSVIAMAFSFDGTWLATVEERDDHETSLESRLKFWLCQPNMNSFRTKLIVEMPHNGHTTAVKFQPPTTALQLLAVTIGSDQKFRLWNYNSQAASSNPKAASWKCVSTGFYKSLVPSALSFSSDGSLLAISFAATLTVWTPENTNLTCSLTHPTLTRDIRFVEFGHKDSCHLVVTASDIYICVWSLLSLSMVWTVDVGVSILVADPLSNHMAMFSSENSLFVFCPSSFVPVFQMKKVTEENLKILKAVFAPKLKPKSSATWQSHSQLYFIAENEELLTLDKPNSEAEEVKDLKMLPHKSFRPLTAFGALMARHSTSQVQKILPPVLQPLKDTGSEAVTEFLAAPCHTMPALTLLCGEFLRSFTICSDSHVDIIDAKAATRMEVDDENEEKMEVLTKCMREAKVSNFDPITLNKELEPILGEDLAWVSLYGVDK